MTMVLRVGVRNANDCSCRSCSGADVAGSDRGVHVDRVATEVAAPPSVGDAIRAARSKPTTDDLLSRELAKPRPIADATTAPRTASAAETVAAPPSLTKAIIAARAAAAKE
jgi:hypothetical protein